MPSSKQPRVYADALIFLNVLLRERGLWPESLKVLKAFDRGDISLVASTMLHAELGGWTGKTQDNETHQAKLRAYLDSPDLVVVEVDTILVRDARALAAKHHLAGCDAVHLAAALKLDADYLFTRDAKLLRIGNKEAPLKISPPSVIWRPTLDDHGVDNEAEAEREGTEDGGTVVEMRARTAKRPKSPRGV